MDKVDIVEQHGKKRYTNIYSAAAWKKVDIVEHRGKGRHSRSRVETAVIAQQRGKGVIVEHH